MGAKLNMGGGVVAESLSIYLPDSENERGFLRTRGVL
jgi:hypothetical protein